MLIHRFVNFSKITIISSLLIVEYNARTFLIITFCICFKSNKLAIVPGIYEIFLSPEVLIFMNCLIQVIQREPWEHIKDVDIKKIAASFCGEIWQVPPMFSAIKVRSFSKL